MNKKIKIAIVAILILILAYAALYMTEYSPAEKTARDCLNGSENVTVSKMPNGLFLDGPGVDNALIFYPGAKVEYISYLPLLANLSNQGVDCYLVEMPFNLAMFGENSADSIIDSTNYTHYFLSGHSLGGVYATSYLNHTGKGDGAILLASYSINNISKPVLSIYGSEDHVLNMKKYDESKPLMTNLTEFVVEGGNHEQFAYYGNQSSDGVAKITPENQQNQTVEKILEFINKNN